MKLYYISLLIFSTISCQSVENKDLAKSHHTNQDSSVAIFTDTLFQLHPNANRVSSSLKDMVSSHEEDKAGKDYDQIELAEIKANFQQINSIDYWDSAKHIAFDKASTISNATFYYQDKALKKVVVLNHSPSTEELMEYYILDDQLSLVVEKQRVLPFHEESEIEESRSYFKNGELVRQLNNQDCGSPFAAEYLLAEKERIEGVWKHLLSL